MEIPTLKAEPRQAAGSRAAARLRRDGKLPAVVYGHKQSVESVALDHHDVELQMERGLHVIKVDLGGRAQPCQFKQAQYDYLGSTLVHIDLIRVDLSERVKVTVQLELRGTPKGAEEGGLIHQELNDLEIECVVSEIPESIRVDVSDLGLDDVRHVKDIELPDGVTTEVDLDAAVAVVRLPIVEEVKEEAPEGVAEGETAAAEPEVIAKGKAEEESEDADKS